MRPRSRHAVARRFVGPLLATVLGAATLLAGCTKREPYSVSDKDQKRFQTIVRIPAKAAKGAPTILALSDCTIYKATFNGTNIVDWKVVLRSDWGGSYPKFMTVCTQQSLRFDGHYAKVDLCAQAIGAGGGCADGGDYRSTNGDRWQIASGSGWERFGN